MDKKNKIGLFGDLTKKAVITVKSFDNRECMVTVLKENKLTAHVAYGDQKFKVHKKRHKFRRISEEEAMKIINDALTFVKTGKNPDQANADKEADAAVTE